MYAEYFGLKQEPFSIAPDPRLLFMSGQHREALAHLLYGVHGGGGFVLLTGEIGTGKTTVCRSFLEQVPEHCNLAYIFNPKLTVIELLETVCHEFGVAVTPQERPATVKDFLDPLNAFLLQAHGAGRNNVLVIDEAQNLAPEVLEQLRLLTNLETSERKLLQIILIGQPELRTMLARPDLEQLAQRVIARYHLGPLTAAECEQYIRHRLEVCGLQRPLPFERAAMRRVHAASGGVPRRINLLCDRALLGAYAGGQGMVTRKVVNGAVDEVFPRSARATPAWWRTALAAGGGLAAGAAIWAAATQVTRPPPVVVPASVQAPAVKSSPAPAAVPLPVAITLAPMPTLWRDEKEAWRELSQAWKLGAVEGDPCSTYPRERVHCFSKPLSLPLIRQLGRPGIATLDTPTGKPSYAILSALNDQTATLRAAGTEQTVTLDALAQRWQGEFATLWRAPEGYAGRSKDGQGGPAIEWVAQRIAAAKGTPPRPGAPRLDPTLRSEIRSFQLAQGLPPDGRPGPMTYMQLNRMAGIEEPRLRTDP